MKIGTVYRASNQTEKQNHTILEVDGCPNFFSHTFMQEKSKIQFQSGAHSVVKVPLKNGGSRIPAIILSSSPHMYGSKTIRLENMYDPDFGRVRYYGDNKSCQTRPETKTGNKLLLEAFQHHYSPIMQEKIDKAVYN